MMAVTTVVVSTFHGTPLPAKPAPLIVPVHAAAPQATISPTPAASASELSTATESALLYTVVLPATPSASPESTSSATTLKKKKPKPTPSPKPSVKPSSQPSVTPSDSPSPSAQPETAKSAAESVDIPAPSVALKPGNNPDLILQLINDHRKNLGLPAFEKDDKLCQIAQYRAPQLDNEIFGNGTIHQGFYDLKLPYWATENAASYKGEQTIVSWWLSDSIHKKAIESTKDKYSCGACSGNSCSQIFSSFIPK